MTQMPEFTNCVIALGFDFGQLTPWEREARIVGLHEDFGYVEAFALLSATVQGLYAALLLEYPDCTEHDFSSFWAAYDHPTFSPAAVFCYDVALVILNELLEHPVTHSSHTVAFRAGKRAFQRLKTPPSTPTLADSLQAILTTP